MSIIYINVILDANLHSRAMMEFSDYHIPVRVRKQSRYNPALNSYIDCWVYHEINDKLIGDKNFYRVNVASMAK